MKKYILLTILFLFLCSSIFAQSYPLNLSYIGLCDWIYRNKHIASGVGLPAIEDVGVWYIDLVEPSAPVIYRSDGSSWIAIASTGGGSGSEINDGVIATDTAWSSFKIDSELDLKADTTDVGKIGNSLIVVNETELDDNRILVYNLASNTFNYVELPVGVSEQDLLDHINTTIDAHGANQTISETLTVGVGSETAIIEYIGTQTIRISPNVEIVGSLLVNGLDWGDHILTTVDAHSPDQTITSSLTLGSGTVDITLERVATDNVSLNSKLSVDSLKVAGVEFDNHTVKNIDAHGVDQTISGSLQLGTGTPDITLERVATGEARLTGSLLVTDKIHSQKSILTDRDFDTNGIFRYRLCVERLAKDSNDLYTQIEWSNMGGVLRKKSVLSGGTSPEYASRTETIYDEDGVSVLEIATYSQIYDSGDWIGETYVP